MGNYGDKLEIFVIYQKLLLFREKKENLSFKNLVIYGKLWEFMEIYSNLW